MTDTSRESTTHMPPPELKFTALDLKRVEPDGTFSGYASLFGVEA